MDPFWKATRFYALVCAAIGAALQDPNPISFHALGTGFLTLGIGFTAVRTADRATETIAAKKTVNISLPASEDTGGAKTDI